MDVGGRTIFLNRFERRRSDRADTFLPTFAKYPYRIRVKIDIGDVVRRKFAQSQSAAVEQSHDRSVAQRHPLGRVALFWNLQGRGQQFLDLLSRQYERQLL